MTKLIAIDPGLNTGWAIFTDGALSDTGITRGEEDIWDFLWNQRTANIWVVEDYKIRPVSKHGWQQTWSSVFPAQVIGACKLISNRAGSKLILQQPGILLPAARLMGLKNWTKESSKHNIDAMLHGHYYLSGVKV